MKNPTEMMGFVSNLRGLAGGPFSLQELMGLSAVSSVLELMGAVNYKRAIRARLP